MKYEYTKDVVCPFFVTQHISSACNSPAKKDKLVQQKSKSIKCEGVYKKSSIILEFDHESARQEHKKNFCASFCYKECPIARMLSKTKYGEDL